MPSPRFSDSPRHAPVIGAALFVPTLVGLMAKGPGFSTSSLVSFCLEPALNGYSAEEASRLIHRSYEALLNSPDVQNTAVARMELLTGATWSYGLTIQSTERMTPDRDLHLNAVSPGFFETLGAGSLLRKGVDRSVHDAAPRLQPRPTHP